MDVTFWETSTDPQRESVPIGEPVWNTGTLILDPTGHPVPVGVTVNCTFGRATGARLQEQPAGDRGGFRGAGSCRCARAAER